MKNYKHYTESIYYQFEQTAKYCKYLGIRLFQKLSIDITVDEYSALDIIVQHDGICQRDLARIILKDRANTGRILNSLESKGYIERFADVKNNRLVRKMKLTKFGKEKYEVISELLRGYIDKIPKFFSDKNRKDLLELIINFRNSLEKEVEMNI